MTDDVYVNEDQQKDGAVSVEGVIGSGVFNNFTIVAGRFGGKMTFVKNRKEN